MPEEELSFFEKKRRELEAAGKLKPRKTSVSEQAFDEDLIPDVLSDRSEEDQEMDRIISNIGIVEAYRRWCGKTIDEKTLNRKEGVMVSCPKPEHPDKNPSAWLNTEKNTWFCGGCQEGGDIYDIANFVHQVDDYKSGSNFHKLRRAMAEDLGYKIKKVVGGTLIYKESDSPSSSSDEANQKSSSLPAEENPQDKSDSEEPDNVSHMWAEEEDAESERIDYPSVAWKDIVPPDTFLWEYCEATSNDDSPEEYHFWHGMLALAHACGRNAYLEDTKPVYGNMLLCLLGGTGFGKSRSRHWLDEVLIDVVPFRDNGLDTSGAKLVSPTASGEALIRAFQHQANDPSLPKNTGVYTPVNGIVDFDEFAALAARANRQGNTLKTTIMGMADARDAVGTQSLTHGEFKAYKPFCSITASTQPRAVRHLLTRGDAGSGFLNRWLFVGGKRKKREIIGGSHSSIQVDLTPAKAHLKKVRGWGAVERKVEMTEDGLKALETFFRKEVFPQQDKDDSDLLKRLDLLFKRLVLLFCINERTTQATAEHVEKARSLFNYVLICYGIVGAEIGSTQFNEISDEIVRHLIRHQARTHRGATPRDLQKYMKRRNYGLDQIKKALETMVSLDMIELEKESNSRPGRKSVRYTAVV